MSLHRREGASIGLGVLAAPGGWGEAVICLGQKVPSLLCCKDAKRIEFILILYGYAVAFFGRSLNTKDLRGALLFVWGRRRLIPAVFWRRQLISHNPYLCRNGILEGALAILEGSPNTRGCGCMLAVLERCDSALLYEKIPSSRQPLDGFIATTPGWRVHLPRQPA